MEIRVKPKTGIWLYRAGTIIDYLFIVCCLFAIWEAGEAWIHDYPLKAGFFWTVIPVWAILSAITGIKERSNKITTIKHRMSNPIKDMK